MYPNLRAEMARNRVTMSDLAGVLGITISTMSQKMNGKFDFSLSEALKIKEAIKCEASIEELFYKED